MVCSCSAPFPLLTSNRNCKINLAFGSPQNNQYTLCMSNLAVDSSTLPNRVDQIAMATAHRRRRCFIVDGCDTKSKLPVRLVQIQIASRCGKCNNKVCSHPVALQFVIAGSSPVLPQSLAEVAKWTDAVGLLPPRLSTAAAPIFWSPGSVRFTGSLWSPWVSRLGFHLCANRPQNGLLSSCPSENF